MEDTDIVIEDGLVVTMDENRSILKGSIAIKDDSIIAVGKSDDIQSRFKPKKKIDARRMAILPGFVNTHNHIWSSIIRSLPVGEGMKIDDHLKVFWRIEEALDRDHFYYGALQTCIENLLSGVTTLADHCYPFVKVTATESTIDAMQESGIRTLFARGIMTKGYEPICETPERAFSETDRLIRQYAGNQMVQVQPAPVSFRQATAEDYVMAKELAEKHNVGLYTHVSETREEIQSVKEAYGKRPIELLHHLGFLTKQTSLVHCVFTSDEEINLLRRTGTSVIHCPSNSMRLAKGVAPVPQMLKSGVNVTIATDDSLTAKQDMFTEMYNVILLHSLHEEDPAVMKPLTALEMSTIYGAKALGLGGIVGSVEVGKKADVILVDLNKPHLQPLNDVVNSLVFQAAASDVDTVIVNGKIVVEHRKVTSVDAQETGRIVERLAAEFRQRISH